MNPEVIEPRKSSNIPSSEELMMMDLITGSIVSLFDYASAIDVASCGWGFSYTSSASNKSG